MIWDGETVLALWGYRPSTTPALSWVQAKSGNWHASDRGVSNDIYEGSMVFQGPLNELTDLEDVLHGNRENFSITCGVGEEIFGAEIDYTSPLNVTVVDYGEIERVTPKSYSMPLRLRLLAPTFKSVTASLAALRLSTWRYGASSEFGIIKDFSYTGAASYADTETDPGYFEGQFTQTQGEMAAIRRYLMTTGRGSSFAFPVNIDYPFGTRMGNGSFTCKAVEWEDLGRPNYTDWEIRIRFARVQ